MKAGKSAIWPWLICQYNEKKLVDLLSSAPIAQLAVYLFISISFLFFYLLAIRDAKCLIAKAQKAVENEIRQNWELNFCLMFAV